MTLLSVVTGTYNRLPFLQLLIASVRRQLPRGISYEIILVDGGSTDGTLEYLKHQPDVRVLQHGALLGAIRAFSDGGKAARGEYVALLNDDVIVHDGALLKAIQHLETHPCCGAVAFADSRTAQITAGKNDFRTEGIGVTLADGRQTMLTYAQCGVFRKPLADAAGWWGADDPIMQHGRTYGGDSYLSARLWEAGYTVEAVEGCAVDDLIARDALRSTYQADGKYYYERFPTVHVPAERARVDIKPRLRVLHLPVYERGLSASRRTKKRG